MKIDCNECRHGGDCLRVLVHGECERFSHIFKPMFNSREEFAAYLVSAIPDVKEAGFHEFAKDFEEALYWLKK